MGRGGPWYALVFREQERGAGRQVRRMQGRREKTWLRLERDQWKERIL